MINSEDIGLPIQEVTVLSTTNITLHYTDGVDIKMPGLPGLISMVMERKISPVTITWEDTGQDSPMDSPGNHPDITEQTGAREVSPDLLTSFMIPTTHYLPI